MLALRRALPWNRRLRWARPASPPFITGDGFRAAAGVVVDALSPAPPRAPVPPGTVVFIGLDGDAQAIGQRIRSALPFLQGAAVVLHNGDRAPAEQLLGAVADTAASVWCVNHLGGDRRVHALPAGLENRWWCANGMPAQFRPRSGRGDRRLPRVLAAFRTRTSPERPRHLDDLRALPACDVVDWLPPRRLHALMREYMLVASPPGNGPDCHRTWEAMYLGAVPVVLRDAFPSFPMPLPALQVDSYRDLAGLDADSIAELHASAFASPCSTLRLDWWIDRIRRSASIPIDRTA